MGGQKDGGAAFPQREHTCVNHIECEDEGMSLRDWFAGQADIPWNACIETLNQRGVEEPTIEDVIRFRAGAKYREADAMLAEREKGGGS